MPTVKSAIREVRDQLFLDRADGEFLSVVSSNLGIDRPIFGFASDSVWRAIVRRLALDYKQVLPVFHDLLTVIFGPQFTVSTVLTEDTEIGDDTLTLADNGAALPQRGTLVLDEGLAAAETVEYSFRDPRTGEVELESTLTLAHTALETSASSTLALPALAGDTTIVVEEPLDFPDPASVGNYPILIDAGKTGTLTDTGGTFSVPTAGEIQLAITSGFFSVAMVGKPIRIAGATTVGNDGVFVITEFVDSNNVIWLNSSGAAEAFTGEWSVHDLDVEEVAICSSRVAGVSGTGDSIGGVAPSMTLTDAAALFTAAMVGRRLNISGAPTAGNNGTFIITSVGGGGTQASYTNAAGAAEAAPAATWEVPSNALGLTAALAYDHAGPTAGSTTTSLTAVAVGKETIFGTDVNEFPEEGLIQLQEDGGTPSEFVRYEDKDNSALSFSLKEPLAGGTYSTAMITLAEAGATVQLAQAQVKGINWDVVETAPNVLRIILPEVLERNRLLDASFLHDSGATPSTTIAAGGGAVEGDTIIEVTDASSFPTAGIIQIGTTEDVSYYRVDRLTAVLYTGQNVSGVGDSLTAGPTVTITDAAGLFTADMVGKQITIAGASNAVNNGTFTITAYTSATQIDFNNPAGVVEAGFTGTWTVAGVGNSVPVGTTELFVSNVTPFVTAAALGVTRAVIDPGGSPETVTVSSIDTARNRLLLAAGTTVAHNTTNNVFETIQAGNQLSGSSSRGPDTLHLMSALTADHAAGQAVDLIRFYHTGQLEDGSIFSTDDHRYQGPYTWDAVSRVPRVSSGTHPSSSPVETTLAENVAGPTTLVVGQRAARTSLEVKDASYFVGPPNEYQQAQIGRGLGGRETRPIRDIVLQKDVIGLTLTGGLISAGATTLSISATGLPDAWGYRLFLDDDGTGTGEEIVIVRSATGGGTSLLLETPTIFNHNGDSVYLLADVIKVDALEFDHDGKIPVEQNQALVPGLFGTDWATGTPPTGLNVDRVALVEEVREYVDVADASSFSATGGIVLINMGKSTLGAESRISDAARIVGPVPLTNTIDFALAGSTITLTDAGAAFTAAAVGRIVKIRNANTAGNNGDYIVTGQTATTLTFENSGGATDAADATAVYSVTGLAIAAATVEVEDGSGFPTANFFVTIGRDTRISEVLEVASRAGNVLTFAAGASGDPTYTHDEFDWVTYTTGEVEQISYESTETGGANERLVFNEELGAYFAGLHVSGEDVNLSTQQAIPGIDGNDYPFYLPSDWADRLEFVFDLARAAGVQIIVSSDR